MGPTHLDKCWRIYGTQTGNHTHILRECPKLKTFLESALQTLQLMQQTKVIFIYLLSIFYNFLLFIFILMFNFIRLKLYY